MNTILLLVSFALVLNVTFAADACGARGRSCVKGDAECKSGSCVCKAPNVKGDGAFGCYKKHEVAAEILNDPMLINFNNESVQFPFPCRYLTTHVMNDLKSKKKDIIGTCEFMVYSFNAKYRGKFFLHGFDVALHIKYNDGKTVKLSSRHYGTARNGEYKFKNKGTIGEFYQNGPWGDVKVKYNDKQNGVRVKVKRDRDNNRLVYQAKRCGVTITFVPYDIKDRRAQVSVPGVSISVDKNYNPRWLSNDEVMALAPYKDGGAMFTDKQVKKLSVEQSIFVRAFKNQYVQNMPMNDKGKCQTTSRTFAKCTRPELRRAMKNCYWMLKQPRFIYCIDKSKNARKILRLFNACVRSWCARTGKCPKIQDAIVKAGCDTVRDIPELPRFMSGKMCPKD